MSEGYEVGKVKVGGMQPDDVEWATKYSRQEIVINSYHCVESFFMLLIAHAEFPECPWLGVLEQKGSEKFKKKIKRLSARKYFDIGHAQATT